MRGLNDTVVSIFTGDERRHTMDGWTRMLWMTTDDKLAASRQREEAEFRAWHRRPDAAPDPEPVHKPDRRTVGSAVHRLVGRVGGA